MKPTTGLMFTSSMLLASNSLGQLDSKYCSKYAFTGLDSQQLESLYEVQNVVVSWEYMGGVDNSDGYTAISKNLRKTTGFQPSALTEGSDVGSTLYESALKAGYTKTVESVEPRTWGESQSVYSKYIVGPGETVELWQQVISVEMTLRKHAIYPAMTLTNKTDSAYDFLVTGVRRNAAQITLPESSQTHYYAPRDEAQSTLLKSSQTYYAQQDTIPAYYAQRDAAQSTLLKSSQTKYAEQDAAQSTLLKSSQTKYAQQDAAQSTLLKSSQTKYAQQDAAQSTLLRSSQTKYAEQDAAQSTLLRSSQTHHAQQDTFPTYYEQQDTIPAYYAQRDAAQSTLLKSQTHYAQRDETQSTLAQHDAAAQSTLLKSSQAAYTYTYTLCKAEQGEGAPECTEPCATHYPIETVVLEFKTPCIATSKDSTSCQEAPHTPLDRRLKWSLKRRRRRRHTPKKFAAL